MTSEIGQAAIRLREEFNWCILPAHTAGKRPICKWKDLRGPRSVAYLARQWSMQPSYNIALLTGRRSGIVVADLDNKPQYRLSLDERLARLAEAGWNLATCQERSGRGGLHIYASIPAGVLVPKRGVYLEPGIELFGDGGLVIVAPSVHASQRRYEWLVAPWECPPAPLPEAALADLLARQPEPQAGTLISPTTPVELTAEQLRQLRIRAIRKVAYALERARTGQDEGRHNSGLWLACQLRDLYLPLADRERCMRAYQKELEAIRVGRSLGRALHRRGRCTHRPQCGRPATAQQPRRSAARLGRARWPPRRCGW